MKSLLVRNQIWLVGHVVVGEVCTEAVGCWRSPCSIDLQVCEVVLALPFEWRIGSTASGLLPSGNMPSATAAAILSVKAALVLSEEHPDASNEPKSLKPFNPTICPHALALPLKNTIGILVLWLVGGNWFFIMNFA